MVMDDIKDDTITGDELATPIEKYKTVGGLISEEKKIYPNELEKETTEKASRANQEQKQQKQQLPTTKKSSLAPETWVEILWQAKRNGEKEGYKTIESTHWKDGVPMIVLAVYPALICKVCGRWNYGTSCQYQTCGNFGVEVKP